MKSTAISTLTIYFLILLSSCEKDTIIASHEIATKDYEFSGYTSLEVNDNFTVYMNFSDTEEKLQVKANDNLLGYVKITQEGNKLLVKLDGIGNIIGTETLKVYITTKGVTEYKAKGNSKFIFDNPVEASLVKINLTGNCIISGTIKADRLDLVSQGNSMLDIAGSIKTLYTQFEGNCELRDYDLTVGSLKMDLSGNSNAYISVTDSISIDAIGNSILSYKGNPIIVHQELSSGSKIVKKG